MTTARLLLGAAFLLGAPQASSVAYQRPVFEPGSSAPFTIQVRNELESPVRTSTRIRLRGHPYWGPPSTVRGAWVDIPGQTLEPGETRTFEISLPVPVRSPPILTTEFRTRGDGAWLISNPLGIPMTTAAEHGFRTVAGGRWIERHDEDPFDLPGAAIRTSDEWDLFRGRLHLETPDSWGLPVIVDDSPGSPAPVRPLFARAEAPDLETETLLAIRMPSYEPVIVARRFTVRSVTARPDGTILCRYAWRIHRDHGGGVLQLDHSAEYLLVAIPKTDAPVVFRRVP